MGKLVGLLGAGIGLVVETVQSRKGPNPETTTTKSDNHPTEESYGMCTIVISHYQYAIWTDNKNSPEQQLSTSV
jgi:hypothetical protein